MAAAPAAVAVAHAAAVGIRRARTQRQFRRPRPYGCFHLRRYNLTLGVFAQNVFNHTNLGTPNGTIGLTSANGDDCPDATQNNGECPQNFFLKSQSLAGGFFGPSSAGNRSVYLSASFDF